MVSQAVPSLFIGAVQDFADENFDDLRGPLEAWPLFFNIVLMGRSVTASAGFGKIDCRRRLRAGARLRY